MHYHRNVFPRKAGKNGPKRGRRAIALLSVFLCACACALGSEKPDLRAIADAAVEHDPSSLGATHNLRAAESDAIAERARRRFDGTVSPRASLNLNIEEPYDQGTSLGGEVSATTTGNAGSQIKVGADYGMTMVDSGIKDTAKLSAGVSLPVFVNGRFIDTRLDEAEKFSAIELPLGTARDSAAAKIRLTADAAIRLALDTASAERSSKLAERRAVIAEKEAVIARVNRTIGNLSFSELSKIEKEADQARILTLESRQAWEMRLSSLCAFTGYSKDDIDPSRFSVPASSLNGEEDFDVEGFPAVLEAARERQAAETAQILQGAQDSPRLNLSADCSLLGPGSRKNTPPPRGEWSASLAVTVPLSFGASSAKKDAAASRVSSAYQNELAAKTEAQEKLASSKNAYVLALARERLREDLLSQAKIRHREVVLAFESRTATQLDVDRALLSVDEAAAALEDDKIARFKAVLDIYALCGIDPRQLFYPEVSSSQ